MNLDYEAAGEILESSTDEERSWKTIAVTLEDSLVQNGEVHLLEPGALYVSAADRIDRHWIMNKEDTNDLYRHFPDRTLFINTPGQRNDAGFHIVNLSGHPYEI